MKKSSKAALVSMFVFPGAGQLLLKRYLSAATFLILAFAIIYQIISTVLSNAMQIVDQITTSGLTPDITTVTHLVSTATMNSELSGTTNMTTILVLIWIISILDCLRTTRLHK